MNNFLCCIVCTIIKEYGIKNIIYSLYNVLNDHIATLTTVHKTKLPRICNILSFSP